MAHPVYFMFMCALCMLNNHNCFFNFSRMHMVGTAYTVQSPYNLVMVNEMKIEADGRGIYKPISVSQKLVHRLCSFWLLPLYLAFNLIPSPMQKATSEVLDDIPRVLCVRRSFSKQWSRAFKKVFKVE